jgi:hypothetical protein
LTILFNAVFLASKNEVLFVTNEAVDDCKPYFRNIMDMRENLGVFVVALIDKEVWVMNVVPVNSSNTLKVSMIEA